MQFSTILLVDDESAHATLVERNLRRVGFTSDIVKLESGQQALDWLKESEPTTINITPFILLDINMPGKSGIEVLAEIKGNENTRHIPVVMLSTTDNPEEIEQCYKLGCNAYITKPIMHDEFQEKIRELGLFMNIITPPQYH